MILIFFTEKTYHIIEIYTKGETNMKDLKKELKDLKDQNDWLIRLNENKTLRILELEGEILRLKKYITSLKH